jgi:hypothetical protein
VRAEAVARELLDADDHLSGGVVPVLAHVLTEVQELRCLLCGETSGELLTQRTPEGTRARFVLAPGIVQPRQGPRGRPRCGRCGGDLYRESAESRRMQPFVPAADVASGCDAA